jgi:hypothetical protein
MALYITDEPITIPVECFVAQPRANAGSIRELIPQLVQETLTALSQAYSMTTTSYHPTQFDACMHADGRVVLEHKRGARNLELIFTHTPATEPATLESISDDGSILLRHAGRPIELRNFLPFTYDKAAVRTGDEIIGLTGAGYVTARNDELVKVDFTSRYNGLIF